MRLNDFVNMEKSVSARLEAHHVAALRLYTSDSYPLFNKPMRDGKKPHPIRVTMYFLDEALEKLRTVEARNNPAAYQRTVYLWRGMKDLTVRIHSDDTSVKLKVNVKNALRH